jgi:hypothetical protein
VLERRRESEYERDDRRARPPEPAPPLRVGTLGWASAVGNQAVARLARQTAEQEAPEAEAGMEPAPEEEGPEGEGEEPAAEELPDELPE